MKRRFFFHWRRATGGWTVHWRGKCIPCAKLVCMVVAESHVNKKQPKAVMRGWAECVLVNRDVAWIVDEKDIRFCKEKRGNRGNCRGREGKRYKLRGRTGCQASFS